MILVVHAFIFRITQTFIASSELFQDGEIKLKKVTRQYAKCGPRRASPYTPHLEDSSPHQQAGRENSCKGIRQNLWPWETREMRRYCSVQNVSPQFGEEKTYNLLEISELSTCLGRRLLST